jgi:hypothetical protein
MGNNKTINRKKEKIEITKKENIGCHVFDQNTLGDIYKEIKSLIEEYGEKASLEVDAGYNNVEFILHYKRLETDVEYNSRQNMIQQERSKEEKERIKIKENEKEQLRKLVKKYPDLAKLQLGITKPQNKK